MKQRDTHADITRARKNARRESRRVKPAPQRKKAHMSDGVFLYGKALLHLRSVRCR